MEKQRIIFTEKTDQVLLEIVRKYKLEETLKQVSEKIKNNKKPNRTAIADVIKSIAAGGSDTDAIASLKNEANISPQIGRKVLDDIKKNAVPSVEKTSEEEILKKRAEMGVIEPTDEDFPETLSPEIEEAIKKEGEEWEKEGEEEVTPQTTTSPTTPSKPTTGGKDTYRETIE